MSFEDLKGELMKEKSNKICFWLFVFGFVYAFFHVMPALLPTFLKSPITWGDMLDFFTPFTVIPLAYLLYFRAKKTLQSFDLLGRTRSLAVKIVLAVGFILYVDGHGLHLSANSIARLLKNMKESELFRATYLFDEIISHFMWDGGVFLISISLIILAYKLPFKSLSKENLAFLYLGAAFYGFTFTVNGIEGQTVVFTFPAAFLGFLLSLFLFLKRRKKGLQNPYLFFFSSAYFLSVLLFAYWGITRSGFPEFSELGWI